MGKIRYIVNYGAPFNVNSKSFKTEYEAKKFIKEHLFGESRYCSLEKVEELDAGFEYIPYYKIKDPGLSDKMFHSGIIKRENLEN